MKYTTVNLIPLKNITEETASFFLKDIGNILYKKR
jgi:hypothetical protein